MPSPRLIWKRLADVLLLAMLAVSPARAQPYARLAVPDSTRAAALRSLGAGYENVWNALLTAQIRAEIGRADSSSVLFDLARRVAAAEPAALGSHIGRDALALAAHWNRAQRATRLAAATAESLAAGAQAAGDYSSADSLYRAALASYRALGERRREAWVLGSLGQNALSARRVHQADSLYREALVARRALGDARMIGNTLNSLGSTSFDLERYDDAYAYFQQARVVREATGERGALANTLNFIGNTQAALGRPDSARVTFRAALDLAVAAGDSLITSSVLINFAKLISEYGESAAAQRMYERALQILHARGDRRRVAVIEGNLGELLRQAGSFTEAVAHFEAAAALARSNRDAHQLRDLLASIGRAWLGLRDPARARPPLQRSLELADSTHDAVGQSLALNNLAICSSLDGDLTGAERLARRALDVGAAAGDSLAVHAAAVTLGETAMLRGDAAAGTAWHGRALSASESLDRGQSWVAELRAVDLNNVARAALAEGRLDAGAAYYRRALEEAERSGALDAIWLPLVGMGDIAERRGDFGTALAFDRRAAALIDTVRAHQQGEGGTITVFARRLFVYEALIHLLGKLDAAFPDSGYGTEAFGWAERARARAFLDLVASGGAAGSRPRILGLPDVKALLASSREALLEYSVGDSSTSLWVVTRRLSKRFTLPARPALRIKIETLRRALADPTASESRAARSAARALYRALIDPAAPLLAGVEHLIVAPDGELARLPFEALLATDPGEGPLPKRAYLVERRAISYVPSASALATRRIDGRMGEVVALGDPCFACGADSMRAAADSASPGGDVLAPLPNTATEVATLARLAAPRTVVALTGREATRARLLGLPSLADAEVIHLATHGRADEAEAERSGLWLAPDAGHAGPGFLSVRDILGLHLTARLVTLSACATGLGRLERGEGILGLARAFLAAGAQSVVVSLWPVSDRSTAELMSHFYGALLGSGASGATALAQAKRALLGSPETRAPFYWAPFVLVGESGALESPRRRD